MYNYAGYQTALATMMATSPTDANFIAILPNCIDYAEQRIYRELDLLNTRYTDASSLCSAGNRLVQMIDTLMVVEVMSIVLPSGQTAAGGGTRRALSPCTVDFLNQVYPSDAPASQGAPVYFAMVGQQQAMVGPCPDQSYNVEIYGTYRPASLSATNVNTPLTVLLPDLFLAASMVFMAGYQKNFGAQADDPKMAMSWETQYQTLMAGAKSEEFRKKFQSSTWSSMIKPAAADKSRGGG